MIQLIENMDTILRKGGDGGNSYVDCMTEEEKERHWKKHREMRTGENNPIYGKHLYHSGPIQKYLSDDEVEEYEKQGWVKGAADYFKEKCSEKMKGENNPFYGKKHSEETMKRINESRKKTYEKRGKYYLYYKGTEQKQVYESEVANYEKEGWTRGTTPESIEKMKITKRNNPTSHPWSDEMKAKKSINFMYKGNVYYGYQEIIDYLRDNGYPAISKKGIESIVYKKKSRAYPELVGQITIKE